MNNQIQNKQKAIKYIINILWVIYLRIKTKNKYQNNLKLKVNIKCIHN